MLQVPVQINALLWIQRCLGHQGQLNTPPFLLALLQEASSPTYRTLVLQPFLQLQAQIFQIKIAIQSMFNMTLARFQILLLLKFQRNCTCLVYLIPKKILLYVPLNPVAPIPRSLMRLGRAVNGAVGNDLVR